MNEETKPIDEETPVPEETPVAGGEEPVDRRDFISSAAMVGGLAAGYGTFAYMAGSFLYPEAVSNEWMFVAQVDSIAVGGSITYRSPGGESIVIVRQGAGADGSDFLALSNVCPHLGCKVHWEAQNNRFFCPCHNGTFDPTGVATGGPPEKAGQSLKQFPLKVEAGLLYIEVPSVALAARDGSDGGHDPCLAPKPRPDDDREALA